MWLGEPDPEDVIEPTEKALNALAQSHVINEKIRSLNDLNFSNRFCEICNYPIADWRKECWVCKQEKV